MAGKNRPAQTDNARVAQPFAHALRRQGEMIGRLAVDPCLVSVRFDDDGKRRQPGRMRGQAFLNGQHAARSGRVYGGGNPVVGLADALAFEYPVTCLDQRSRKAADTLVQWHDQLCRQRRLPDRSACRFRFVRLGLDAAFELEQGKHQAARLTLSSNTG